MIKEKTEEARSPSENPEKQSVSVKFEDFGLPPEIMTSLKYMEYTAPTPIQAQAIPMALEGKDILGSAQTGTGKTAAFAIPLITYLLNNPSESAIVLTPTRELAAQVMEIMQKIVGRNSRIRTALLIGGGAMRQQLNSLQSGARLIVGTPGRVNDHLDRRTLNLSKAGFLVLDETDRMLDMGFGIQIDDILRHVPTDRQTLLFSATLPKGIVRLSQKYLNNPERVAVGSVSTPIEKIKQEVIRMSEAEKYPTLIDQLDTRKGSILIFVKTKRGADQLAFKLNRKDYDARPIHGDLKQNQRNRVIQDFRNQKCRILVATDVVARGLDIPHIEHVINYDLPECPEDYIHRIGRTARAGAEGSALCLVAPQDNGKWGAINRMLNPDAAGSDRGGSGGGQRRSFRSRGGDRGGSGGSGGSRGGSRSRGGPSNRSSFGQNRSRSR